MEVDDFDGKDHVGVVLVDGFVNSAVEAFSQEVKFEDVGFEFVSDDVVELNEFDILSLRGLHWGCFFLGLYLRGILFMEFFDT